MAELKKKILIVEDEGAMVTALQDKLTYEGFVVVSAGDGLDGLGMAQKEKPDLILLDILMPEMDGMTMLKKLRASDWGRDIPVIILTNLNPADHLSEGAKEFLDPGYFLVKTEWTLDQVVQKVRERLGVSK